MNITRERNNLSVSCCYLVCRAVKEEESVSNYAV